MYMHIHDSVVRTSDTAKSKRQDAKKHENAPVYAGAKRYTNGETKRNTNINKKKMKSIRASS